MNKNKQGYSLLELMIVVSILSIVSVIAFNSLKGVRDNYAVAEDEVAVDLREILKQEFILQGINPEEFQNPMANYGDVEANIDKTENKLNAFGKNSVSILKVNFKEDRERLSISGKIIEKRGEPISFEQSQLMMPKANYFGTIDVGEFPLKNFILSGNNPLGTYYRYTIDGIDPTSLSPVWKFSALNLANWSPVMKFRAFNADSRYIESDVLEVNLSLKASVAIKREDGSSSLGVSYNEISSQSNRLVIIAPGRDPSIGVRYRMAQGSDLDYNGPFHVPLSNWGSVGVKLIVDVRVPYFTDPISSQEFLLYVKKEQWAMPQIDPQTMTVRTGAKVQISTNRNIATTVTTIDGQDEIFYLIVEEI